jgi:outer membrane protein OmpA-like peptidoglycan-associated protein
MVPVGLVAAVSCGGATLSSQELVNARAAYVRAQTGPAAQLDPADLHEAHTALDRAEVASLDDATSPETRDLAAIAELKAETAEARASMMQSLQLEAQATKDKDTLQKAQLTYEQLLVEQQRRAALEQKLADAMTTLQKVAAIKDTDRGLVITFQGDVLFKTGESTLKAEAMLKLDQVAESLRGQERRIVVEGHADMVGGVSPYNQNLSEQRAMAVRDYLVSKGVPADLIRSVGYGATRPISDNTSPEGRAANRRVEIIVEPRSSQTTQ